MYFPCLFNDTFNSSDYTAPKYNNNELEKIWKEEDVV